MKLYSAGSLYSQFCLPRFLLFFLVAIEGQNRKMMISQYSTARLGMDRVTQMTEKRHDWPQTLIWNADGLIV
jgi:hypothetical protein